MRLDFDCTDLESRVISISVVSSLCVTFLAIYNGSLWLDEFGTWYLTQADSLSAWGQRFLEWPDSDTQTPIYHFFMYFWVKAFGSGAIALRASNVAFFVVGNAGLIWPFRHQTRMALMVSLITALSASLWYYLNELRPYIMLYMGACLMIGGAIELLTTNDHSKRAAVAAICAGAIAACGATIIGVIWVGAIALLILIYWLWIRGGSLASLLRTNRAAVVIAVVGIFLLVAHSVRMFALGKRPALLESDPLGLLFALYANIGLLGIGPGMLDLRNSGASALVPFVPALLVATIFLGALAILGIDDIRRRIGNHGFMLLIACLAVPFFSMFMLSWVLGWRVLPRHFIPIVAVVTLAYAAGVLRCWRGNLVHKLIAVLAIGILGISALSVRMMPRHAREDYRQAAYFAAREIASGGRVWWVADFRGALYYGVPYVNSTMDGMTPNHKNGALLFVGARTPSEIEAAAKPTLVVMSRPESYDTSGVVRGFLTREHYSAIEHLHGFSIWRP